ncbi:MAG TPA: cyclase family protein [Thermoanaerobaculia bacterium]|nr:cyclase family protein [Thermoanaerobaculia bacterium]
MPRGAAALAAREVRGSAAMLYDLSPRIGPGFPVWPGDTPYAARLTWKLAEGASVNLSALTTTPHLGSHADAPFHTEAEGGTAADLPLEAFLGPCRVVDVTAAGAPDEAAPGEVGLVEPRHLDGIDLCDPPRLLLKTGSMPPLATGAAFPERFAAISPALAERLAAAGTLLVGLDTPSVDPFDSQELPAHHALARGGVAILEGLVLAHVPPGLYELIALPLKIEGLDASPVRAVLRSA